MKKNKKEKNICKDKFVSKKFDPLGSWTGNATNKTESPEQDADDL